jgi:hypothetical protein
MVARHSHLRLLVLRPTAVLGELSAFLLGVRARRRVEPDVDDRVRAVLAPVVDIHLPGCVFRAEPRAVDAMGVLGFFEIVAIIRRLCGRARRRMTSDGGTVAGWMQVVA